MNRSRFAVALICLFVRASFGQLVTGVDSVGITVSDMNRVLPFYTNTLPFQVVSDTGTDPRVVRLKLGDEFFVLTDYAQDGRSIPADSRSNDRWFQHIAIIVSDMDKAYAHFQAHNVQHVSPAPQTIPAWNKGAAGIRAFYFRDPDNHNLEILWFPPGKGSAKWQAKDRLFLGIDHTAIAVSDTETSLNYYRDTLGLKVAGTSENYGPEQERLNNVPGAHLRITSLRGATGPAIEFLEYLSPRDGRPSPADSTPRDVWHWQIKLRASQPARDPDGHALLLE
jgi:catechol 2,3-dioxygenase-like lactoylglutathione lyase family enzyme